MSSSQGFKNQKGKVYFAITLMKEFKPHFIREGFMSLMDELKHLGISRELMDSLQNQNETVHWWTEDENEKTWVAVEIIKK